MSTETTDLALPLSAILCIAFGLYLIVILIALFIGSILQSRGVFKECCACCSEGQSCCSCFFSLGEACSCYDYPTFRSCLNAICPPKKKLTVAEVVMCQCCSCCNNDDSACDCPFCSCNCQCKSWDLSQINCLCCVIQPKRRLQSEEA